MGYKGSILNGSSSLGDQEFLWWDVLNLYTAVLLNPLDLDLIDRSHNRLAHHIDTGLNELDFLLDNL